MQTYEDYNNKELITVWVVTPHASGEFDEWWGACETEEDHDAAYEYASYRLEDMWDQYDSSDPRVISVTMEQREVEAWEFELTHDE